MRHLIALAAAAALLAPTSVALAADAGAKEIHSDKLGLGLTLPKGWKQGKADPKTGTFKLTGTTEEEEIEINDPDDRPADVGPKDVLKAMQDSAKDQFKSVKAKWIKGSIVKLNGDDVSRLDVVVANPEGVKLHMTINQIFHGDKVWTINVSCLENDLKTEKAVIDGVLASFKYDDDNE